VALPIYYTHFGPQIVYFPFNHFRRTKQSKIMRVREREAKTLNARGEHVNNQTFLLCTYALNEHKQRKKS
jgi:hypothetical protein